MTCINCTAPGCITDLLATITEGTLSGWVYDSWTFSASHVYNCSGPTMLGGYNIMGINSAARKTYTLQPHFQVKLSIRVFSLDSVDANEKV